VACSLLAALCIATFNPSAAQARKLTLGAALGPSQSSFGGDVEPDSKYEGTIGFAGGLFFDYYLKDDVALSIQPMLVQKGADQVWRRGDEELNRVEYRTNYLSIPLALKVTGTSRSRMYAHGSIDFNFLLDGDRTENGETEAIGDLLKDFEIGTSFGVGGLIAIGNNYLMIEGRYSQGLSNIAGPQITENDNSISIKNTGFLFLVGWLFQLGGAAQ